MHRMGPGLFPTLVGVLLAGLLVIALRAFAIDGPPVPRFHARPIIISLVAIALFGVALAHLGLIAAVAVLVLVGAAGFARKPSAGDRRPRRGADRVFGRGVRLAAGPADPALAGGLSRGNPRQSRLRPRRRADLAEHRLLLHRLLPRHAGRRASRHRSGGDGGDAAAVHVQPRAGAGADHAGRHLLRRAIRRLDHGDPGQHPG